MATESRSQRISEARRAVLNLQKAYSDTNASPGASLHLIRAIQQQLFRAQARLAELTGSVEP